MIRCPNCGERVADDSAHCSNCGFDLQKFRTDYFTDRNVKRGTDSETEAQMLKRAIYQKEFKPKHPNSTVGAMIAWIRVNAMIVFLLGIALLILMSFSRPLGWLSFLGLMVWLFIVCDKEAEIDQYTADKRLTDKVNQVGSNLFNRFETHEKSVRRRYETHQEKHGRKPKTAIRHRHTRWQLSIGFMALISLLLVFFGPYASYATLGMVNNASISHVLLFNTIPLGSRYIWIGYGLWGLLVFIPLALLILIYKNNSGSDKWLFLLSLIETLVLIFVATRLLFNSGSSFGITTRSFLDNGDVKTRVTQVFNNAISFGISSYLLLISSVMTTALSFKNLKAIKKAKSNQD